MLSTAALGRCPETTVGRDAAQARAVLDALLTKYWDENVLNLDDPKVLQIPPFTQKDTPL